MKRIIEAILFLGASILLTSCGLVKSTNNETANSVIEVIKGSYPHDNIAEEILENKIEDWTGIDLDLTPSSPEK